MFNILGLFRAALDNRFVSLLMASTIGAIVGSEVSSLYSSCGIEVSSSGISLQSADYGCLLWHIVISIAYVAVALVLVLLICTALFMVPYYAGIASAKRR